MHAADMLPLNGSHSGRLSPETHFAEAHMLQIDRSLAMTNIDTKNLKNPSQTREIRARTGQLEDPLPEGKKLEEKECVSAYNNRQTCPSVSAEVAMQELADF